MATMTDKRSTTATDLALLLALATLLLWLRKPYSVYLKMSATRRDIELKRYCWIEIRWGARRIGIGMWNPWPAQMASI